MQLPTFLVGAVGSNIEDFITTLQMKSAPTSKCIRINTLMV